MRKSTWSKQTSIEEVKKDMPKLAVNNALSDKIGAYLAKTAKNALKIEQDKLAFQEQETARMN